MIILAIDPGTVQSAWLVWTGSSVANHAIEPNVELIARLRQRRGAIGWADCAVIEQIASYGMPVGAEVFETVRWSGRFEEALYPVPVHQLPRRAVKLHLCGSARAKDANVRQALLDKFGGRAAIGRKAAPGPLYGIKSDLWAAFGVAVTFAETLDTMA
uniref:Uncharacterized protein n=1 Tax=viral metagenome TaxID=1070528 RepID=A0A6M3LMW5_9ZZZZ